jgi:hypothetical protein
MRTETTTIQVSTYNNQVTQMMQDQGKRNKVIKILVQTLYNLGYHESAKELQLEANVKYYDPVVLSIKE